MNWTAFLRQLLYDPANPLIFNSSFFLGFFIVLMLFYPLVVSRIRVRTWYLLLFSLYFYYKTSGVFLLLLLLTAGINFVIGSWIAKANSKAAKKRLIWLSIAWNLGSLGWYKYTNFIIDTINQITGGSIPAMDIFLPVGISFFTFQTMSYTLDIYFGKLEPIRSFADFAFFVSFFPQLVAGPILRASQFIPQINARLSLDKERIAQALVLIFAGLIKKGVIADYISLNFVDRVFDNPALFSGVENLLAVYGYGLQIYCDFSGYSDIAIGLATLMGFHLPANFNSPYRATSITDFWRRWHISLSSWLRDYLYIPLGGNRKGKVRTYINLLLTMLLGGLWHGASWNFVFWGGIHGIALAIDKFFIGLKLFQRVSNQHVQNFLKLLGVLLTFNFVSFAWIFFRSQSFSSAWQMISLIFNQINAERFIIWISQYRIVAALIALGYLLHWLPKQYKVLCEKVLCKSPILVQSIILAIIIWVLFQFKSSEVQPFIYFQF
ncbi:MAG TPA: MBOAT family O-acyltransferase [Candidatus Cloacimonadota bacterium]|nr:MBOAT family O-acyltransferase [Candidatus Cloacimonadota bacterium]